MFMQLIIEELRDRKSNWLVGDLWINSAPNVKVDNLSITLEQTDIEKMAKRSAEKSKMRAEERKKERENSSK